MYSERLSILFNLRKLTNSILDKINVIIHSKQYVSLGGPQMADLVKKIPGSYNLSRTQYKILRGKVFSQLSFANKN